MHSRATVGGEGSELLQNPAAGSQPLAIRPLPVEHCEISSRNGPSKSCSLHCMPEQITVFPDSSCELVTLSLLYNKRNKGRAVL